jgi:Fe-S cluster assembly protein SufD
MISPEVRAVFEQAEQRAAGIGPPWTQPLRQQALRHFFELGFPGARDGVINEDWKYTSLGEVENTVWNDAPPSALHDKDVDEIGNEDFPGHALMFVDGQAARYESDLPAGTLTRLDRALAGMPPALMRHFGKLAGESALVSLNAALWRQGACLHVPAGMQIAEPIFVAHRSSAPRAMPNPRTLAVLEEGAAATLVEDYSGNSDHWSNAVTEIALEPGARLLHVKLTREGAAGMHTGLSVANLARDSHYTSLSISLSGRLARHDIHARLQGTGAACDLNGLFIAAGRDHVDHHTRIEHLVPRTVSRETYRGVATGRGRGVFDGRIVVHPGALKSDARQSSRNLLLSPHAEIDAKPQLEIYADDVQCSHGATVSRLDDAQKFYLNSRGLDDAEARALLLWAFAREALAPLAQAALKDWITRAIAPHLPTGHDS